MNIKTEKKIGKGKEYFGNGKLIYEDEYLNNKKIGKGKEYYDSGDLLFDDEYLYGSRIKEKTY